MDLSDIEQELDDKADRSCINLVQIECPQIGGQVFDEASVIKKLDEDEAENMAQEDQMIDIDLDLTSPAKQLMVSEIDEESDSPVLLEKNASDDLRQL